MEVSWKSILLTNYQNFYRKIQIILRNGLINMKKGYWVSLYFKIDNKENLKKYSELATPVIKSYGGVRLIRGGKHDTFNGDDFSRTVVWEFRSYAKALECHSSKEYQDSWAVAKKTTKRHMQVVEGFSTE